MEHKMTLTEAAQDFAGVVERAFTRGESTLVLRSGVPIARIVPLSRTVLLGRDLSELWTKISHLTREDAERFDNEWKEARSKLRMPDSKWD